MTKRQKVTIDGDEMGKRSSWLAKRKDRSERGDTMVEILLSLIVLGLTSVALLIGFSTTLSASAEHRQLASANLAINNYSQQVTAGIEADSTLFTCPTPAYTPATFMAELAITTTAPYSPTITSIQYWNPTTDSFGPTCVVNASELITVSVLSGSKNETLSFVVNSPTAGSNFVGGIPTGMKFTTPAFGASTITAISGASLPVIPVVEVFIGTSPDATDLSPITLTLGDPSGQPTALGTLSGCSSNDLNGVVTYSGCTISLTTSSGSATNFTLVAATPGLSNAISGQIAVTGSTSSYLKFTTQPSAGDSGALMTTEPVVTAYQGGTTTVDTTRMSITLTTSGSVSGSPQLTSCAGTTNNSTTTESNGVVTITNSAGNGGIFTVTGCDFSGQFFYDVNSGAVGTPYTMTASSPNVTSATSQPFAATGYGVATQMVFIAEPSGGSATTTGANTVTLNSFEIAVEDSWGNILSGQGQAPYAGSVTVNVTGGAVLTCTPTFAGGIFSFSGCSAALGTNLTLTATASGTGSTDVTPEPSTDFNDTGPVFQLVWYNGYPQSTSTGQPVAGASGGVMTNQPVLAYEDAGTNPGEAGPVIVTSDTTSISYTSAYSSGTQGTPLNGILTTCSNLPPINGIISAGNCTFVGLVGTNYTMKAATTSGTVITSPVSATFSPTGPGPASQLVFTPSPGVEPTPAAAGSPFTTEPVAVIEDLGGNFVSSATTQVEMNSYLTSSPTVQGGSLLNCSTYAPVNGAVSLIPVGGYLDVESSCAFGGVVGTSYELIDTAPGLTSAVSTAFTPTTFGPASAIAVSGCSPGVNYKSTCVLSAAVQDAWGNLVTTFASGVTFADVGGAGTVSGLGTFTASGGVANDSVTGANVGPELVTATEGSISSLPYSFSVNGDTTTATLTESSASVVYGSEGSSVFTVTVATGNHEALPTPDTVTVNVGVGGANCVVTLTPTGTGGTGTCSLTATPTVLAASATPYAVSATYAGDAQLQASPTATVAGGLTVTKDATTVTLTESSASVVYGSEGSSVFTVTVVTGNHEALPTPDTVTVNVGVGGANCVVTLTPTGTGGTGTCSLTATPTVLAASATYAVSATYAGDTSLSGSGPATVAGGLTVTKDATTVTLTESSASVVYGSEGSSVFTVTVATGNHEALPTPDTVTVNVGVGGANCVVTLTPTGTGGTGTCSLTATPTVLAASATPYAVSATYAGDTSLSGSGPATVAGGLTVNQAPLVITASSPTVTYGGAVPTITASYATFVGGQGAGNLTPAPTCITAYTTSSTAGSSPSTSCSGAVDANYAISYVAGHVTVSQATPNVTITNTVNPTGIGAGNLVLTATVTGVNGDAPPSGTLTWNVKINGVTSGSCTTNTLAGSGPSTATCTLATPGAGTYTATATYGGDTNYGALTTPSTFGMYVGQSPLPDVPTGPEYYTINSSTIAGSGTNTANTITPGAETLTSIKMTFSGGAPSGSAQTVTVGQITSGTYSTTAMTCMVSMNTNETCAYSGTPVSILSGSSINIAAQGSSGYTDFWIVTYTNP